MAKKIELKFENEDGRTVTYSLDNPVEPFEEADVNTAMDAIVSANVFTSTGGDIVSKKAAQIVERNVTEIPLS